MMIQRKKAVSFALAATLALASLASQAVTLLRSMEDVAKIRVGTTTEKEVRALLGDPSYTQRDARRNWNGLQYYVFQYGERSIVWVSVSDDGVVREVIQMPHKRISGAT